MIRSFFVPFVHSLHIEISLNLSVFLRDSLSENTSFISFTVSKRLRDSILSAFFHSYIFAMYKNEALRI